MKIAFLNLCHTDPDLVARSARKLTNDEHFGMFLHIDAKQDEKPFREALSGVPRVSFTDRRHKVYWGGFNAVKATFTLLAKALASSEHYDYFVLLQNLDYPIKSNVEIRQFFEASPGTEYIRGCNIAHTKDWHFARKYKIYNRRDDDFYLQSHTKARMYLHYAKMRALSAKTVLSDGVIREEDGAYPIYYGCAQWAVTRECAKYMLRFYMAHPAFNRYMQRVQFPDEHYFHTVVHNSPFREKCALHDEQEQRWLVNWRNLHYFEYPREITVFTEKDFTNLMSRSELFIRKVKTGISDALLNRIDFVTQ